MPRDRKPFSPNKKSDLKTRLVHFLGRQSAGADRREIMRGLKLGPGSQKALDLALTNAEAASQIRKAKGGRYAVSKNLPPVTVIEVTGVNEDGEPMARPVGRDAEGPGPKITVREKGRRGPALGTGDRALAKLRPAPGDGDNAYDAEIIRRLTDGPKTVLGIYDGDQKIQSTDRRDRSDFTVEAKETGGAKAGELVVAEVGTRRRAGMLEARIIERLGVEPGPHAYSQISIHTHGLPTSFGEEALAEAESAGAASLGDRTDLRDIALVTIDGKDARDFDDAVWADADAENEGGWHLIVAIADVTWYVRPYSALDTEARLRGNSTYFPDRVVPMLPEALSNGWCSLKPDEDRSCLAAHLWINKHGKLIRHRFERALMRSVARLTYEQVQAYRDGNSTPPAGISARLNALYGAYEAFSRARDARGALDLEIPEQLVELDESGNVSRIGPTLRLDSHKLIEEFMIAANVAAAETLEKCRRPLLYRIHDQPPPDKLDAFRQFVSSLGLTMAKGQVLRPSDFNRLIEQAQAIDYGHLVDQAVLRSQAKAEYSPSNLGHFGLGLRNYCHFTSPIRRYADLMVHRALVSGLGLGEGGLPSEPEDWNALGELVTETERRSVAAERDANDRFAAAYYAARKDEMLSARVSGVTRYGLFVTLSETLADGFVPMSHLPEDYYRLDEVRRRLVGRRSKLIFRIGDLVECKIRDSDPLKGSLILEIIPKTRRPKS